MARNSHSCVTDSRRYTANPRWPERPAPKQPPVPGEQPSVALNSRVIPWGTPECPIWALRLTQGRACARVQNGYLCSRRRPAPVTERGPIPRLMCCQIEYERPSAASATRVTNFSCPIRCAFRPGAHGGLNRPGGWRRTHRALQCWFASLGTAHSQIVTALRTAGWGSCSQPGGARSRCLDRQLVSALIGHGGRLALAWGCRAELSARDRRDVCGQFVKTM
jgi:hypothetical protein